MTLSRIFLVLVVLATSVPVNAQPAKKALTLEGYLADHYAMMRDFGRCAALQEHLAMVIVAAGKPANAEEMRGFARGADLVANVGTYIDELEQIADSSSDAAVRDGQARIMANQRSLDSIKQLERVRQLAFAERGEIDIEQMKFCVSLNQVQTTIVETMRESGFLSQ